jgi:hypothetical protein
MSKKEPEYINEFIRNHRLARRAEKAVIITTIAIIAMAVLTFIFGA